MPRSMHRSSALRCRSDLRLQSLLVVERGTETGHARQQCGGAEAVRIVVAPAGDWKRPGSNRLVTHDRLLPRLYEGGTAGEAKDVPPRCRTAGAREVIRRVSGLRVSVVLLRRPETHRNARWNEGSQPRQFTRVANRRRLRRVGRLVRDLDESIRILQTQSAPTAIHMGIDPGGELLRVDEGDDLDVQPATRQPSRAGREGHAPRQRVQGRTRIAPS